MTQAWVDGFAELTLEVRDREAMERLSTDNVLGFEVREARIEHQGPLEHEGGDRSLSVEDPEGVVEIWDLFRRGAGRCEGIGALAQREAAGTDASN